MGNKAENLNMKSRFSYDNDKDNLKDALLWNSTNLHISCNKNNCKKVVVAPARSHACICHIQLYIVQGQLCRMSIE
jgi:hypothetical protein